MKVVALFLIYDNGKYPAALTYFQKYLDRLHGYEKELIVIDNKLSPNRNLSNFNYIMGDNTLWEFTGWTKGVEFLKKNNIDYDAIIFANDAFLAPSGINDLGGIICSGEGILKAIEQNKMLGNLACNPDNLIIDGYNIESHIRTNCFVIPKKVIEELGTIHYKDLAFFESCIPKNPEFPYFAKDAPLNSVAKRHLINIFENLWHSSPKNGIEANTELFRMKSYALMHELLLTARCREIEKKLKG